MHPQSIFVDIKGCQEVSNTVRTMVSRAMSNRAPLGSPRTAGLRSDLDGTELIEADYR